MSRSVPTAPLLASFQLNGATCTQRELEHLGNAEKSLVAMLSYCLLSCRDHIRYSHDKVTINLHARNSAAGWEVENWDRLKPGLRIALSKVFASNAMLPPPLHSGDVSGNQAQA